MSAPSPQRRRNTSPEKSSGATKHSKNSQQSTPQQASQKNHFRKRPVGVREELDELKEQGAFMLWLRGLLNMSPGFASSALVHAVVIIILMLIAIVPDVTESLESILASNEIETEDEKFDEINPTITEHIEVKVSEDVEFLDSDVVSEVPEDSEFMQDPASEMALELSAVGIPVANPEAMMNPTGNSAGKNPLDGRGRKSRAKLAATSGGTPGSEAAVAMGLKWIAAHQNPDGSWSFNHGMSPQHQGPVRDPGSVPSLAGATGFALMPFLGAGQTHKDGEYKDTVYKGLHYLSRAMKFDPQKGGDLRGEGGNMYCHGLGAITLCEAYALTRDKSLMAPAQQALNFIVYAQDKTGGGWRYKPGEAGDTSVVGWQVMALKSGHLAYLNVPKNTIAGVTNFLNLVEEEDSYGAYYGYDKPGKRPATTAIGLLCRMYLGWKKGEPGLVQGVKYLSDMGPSKSNMYYNYYATQVLHHYGGEEWQKWNAVMRDQLVNTQITNGSHFTDKGSWTPHEGHGKKGGRLYETAMSVMTLEVYYRYLPLYDDQPVAGDDF